MTRSVKSRVSLRLVLTLSLVRQGDLTALMQPCRLSLQSLFWLSGGLELPGGLTNVNSIIGLRPVAEDQTVWDCLLTAKRHADFQVQRS
jgi:hypothetical protein